MLRAVAPTVFLVGCVLLWFHGFLGLSNDDAARALIAWDTAHAPSIDPTRSSWLPLHSLLLGALMALADSPRFVPYAVSLGSGLVAVGALSKAIRRESISVLATTVALSVAACWRWSLLSAASGGIPEMTAVALLCVALERWCSGSRASWWQSGLALTLAAGFRYEPWFAIVGFALVARDHARLRVEIRATLGLAAVVPLAWIVLNHLRRGDALDFLHRVSAHRGAVSAMMAPWWSRWTDVPRTVLVELPWIAVALVWLVRSRRRPRLVVVGAGMALAVVAGLTLEAARGGGPTHHAARTMLPVAWLLVPALAAALDDLLRRRRAVWIVAGALACGAWSLPRPAEIRSPGVHDASVTGQEVARRWPEGAWCLELQRQDALWIEWRSGRSRQVIPDRVFGAAPADVRSRAERCVAVGRVVISSWEMEEALKARGLQVVRRQGPWAVMERPM